MGNRIMKKSSVKHKTRAAKRAGSGSGSGKTDRSGEVEAMRGEEMRGRTIHNGSAGAFDATEHSHDEDDEDQDNDDFAMDR
jgi:hypothetical protein